MHAGLGQETGANHILHQKRGINYGIWKNTGIF